MTGDAESLHQAGLAALRRGDKDAARSAFERALELEPSRVKTLNNLARLELEAGRPRRAHEIAERALAVEPDAPRSLALLGQALLADDRASDASPILERAAAADPGQAATWAALARAVRRTSGDSAATEVLRRAVSAVPASAPLWNNLGSALVRSGPDSEALLAFERSVELDPRSVEALGNLGDALRRARRPDRAEEVLRRALALGPSDPAATASLAIILDETLRQDESTRLVASAMAIAKGDIRRQLGSSHLFHLNHYDGVTPQELLRAHRAWATEWLPPGRQSSLEPRARTGPLRIGYLSSDFRDHVVMKFLLPVLAKHDPSRVRVYLLSLTRERDAVTKQIEARHEVVDLVGKGSHEIAAETRRLALDVVIELNGHTDDAVLMAFEERLAPVQLSWLGYPSTTGLDRFEGRITDADVDPPGTDAQFSEPLVRLPRCMWAFVPTTLPEVATRPPDGRITFGCFNRVSKLSRATTDAWSELLRRVPGSRLLLRARSFADPAVRARALDRFGAQADRVEFAPFAPNEAAALAGYGEVDVALDTFPYHGTTTTCDALAMGVPVVSWQGELPASRVGRSLLRAVGLGDLAVEGREGFVEQAARLAGDGPRRAALRSTLRSAMLDGALGDTEGLARALEDAFYARAER